MNLSSRKARECRERDGPPAEDRADRVDESLLVQERLGFNNGLPLVHNEDLQIPLGEPYHSEYDHYIKNDDLLLPDAHDFLQELADHELVGSIEDISDELNTDRGTVEKAVELHDIEVTESTTEASTSNDGLVFPNGEEWPCELLETPVWEDSRVLCQLLATDGMGIGEATKYLERQLGENSIDESEVRQAAVDSGLLDGERSSEKQSRGVPHPSEDLRL